MPNYLFPIKLAIIFFPFVAFLISLPFAIYQYRRYGYINKLRVIVFFSFILYILTAYYLVIMPLPKTRDVKSIQRTNIDYYNLKPFSFVEEILRKTKVDFKDLKTYPRILGEFAFLQSVFNVFLTLPFGFYLRYYFKRNLKETVFYSLLLSLFFEITQLTGLYGIYNAPYRIFDVDDLILNTLGGSLGYLVAPILTFFLPDMRELDQDVDLENIRVGFLRRFIALAIDFLVLGFIPGFRTSGLVEFTSYFLYFIVLTWLTNGRTLGKLLTRTRIQGPSHRLRFRDTFLRYGTLYFGVFGSIRFINALLLSNQDIDNVYMFAMVIFVQLSIVVFVGLDFLVNLVKKKRLFYEKFSRSSIVVDFVSRSVPRLEAEPEFKKASFRLAGEEDLGGILKLAGLGGLTRGYIEKTLGLRELYVLYLDQDLVGLSIIKDQLAGPLEDGQKLFKDYGPYLFIEKVLGDGQRGIEAYLLKYGEELGLRLGKTSLRTYCKREDKALRLAYTNRAYEYCGKLVVAGEEIHIYEKYIGS